MDIGGPLLDRAGEDSVDQLYDGRFFHLGLKRRYRYLFFLSLVHYLDVFVTELFEEDFEAVFARLVVLLDGLTERILTCDHRLDIVSCREPELVDGIEVLRIGHGHRKRAADAT